MPTDAMLILNQWFSPGYPLGSFAYSHGLEGAIQDGRIATAAQLEDWLHDIVTQGTGRSDAVLLHAATRCTDAQAALALDAQARAFSLSAERLLETCQQGAAFVRTTAAVWQVDLPPALCFPVAVGFAARALGLPPQLTATLYLQAFVANLVSCAVRLVPLGQTQGQAVLHRLAPLCARISADTRDTDLDALSGATFAADIAAMQHETLTHRTFRT